MTEPAPAPRPRRPLHLLAYLGFLLVLVEVGAWSFLALEGKAAGIDVLTAELSGAEGVPVPGAELRRREGLHPYLGFLPKDRGAGVPSDVYMIWQQRLYDADSPLFSTDERELVVGISGGSVAGQFSRFGGAQQLAKLLDQSPQYQGRRVRFVVIAYGGVKQPQQLMGLTYLLALGGRLDLLINLDGFNEVALHEKDNQGHGVSPIYPRSWLPRVGSGEFLLMVGQQRNLEQQRRALAEDFRGSWLSYSGVRRAAWILADRDLEAQLAEVSRQLREFEPASVANFINQGPDVAAESLPGRLDQLVDIWRESSLQLHRMCEANGIEYYHFLQPNQYVEGSKELSDEELAEAWRPGEGYGGQVPAGYPRLQAAGDELTRAGVRFHDLTGIYQDVTDTVYVDDCCHVNGLGNQLMADAIREAILSWGE